MINSHIINLDRNEDRWREIRDRFHQLDLQFERFKAVDGKTISDDELEIFAAARPRVTVIGKWTKGKMGCHLSHRALWKAAAEGPHRYTAIFEDDILVSDSLRHFLAEEDWIPADADIVRLESPAFMRVLLSDRYTSSVFGRKLKKILPNKFRNAFPMGAGGYIIEKNAARRLLETPLEWFIYTDRSLFDHSVSKVAGNLIVYQVAPACCIQDKFFHENPADIRFQSEIETVDDADIYVTRNKGFAGFFRHVIQTMGARNAYTLMRDFIFKACGYTRVPYEP